jgi:uncharacterized protein YjbI with pentapeptide repeats
MSESDKLAEKIGIVVQGGQVTIHTVSLGQAETALPNPAPTELLDCPYRGLFAFQEEHVEFFFGRDIFTQGLVQAVQTKPLVAVVGASGSGKSSLVFAGLLPKLLEQGGWCIFKLRPGFPDSRPFHNLTSALLPLSAVPDLDPLILLNQRAKALQEGTVSLRDVIAEILRQAPTGTERVLLVVDQFEELYTLCSQEDRERFVDLLLAGVNDAPCKVVLTLRADFCGQAYAYRPLVDALQDADLKLGSMNQEELQAAIEKPAEKMGVKLEAGLTQRILDDVGKEPGNLPLLEFALTRLWNKQQNRELTHAAYSDIGGVKQALADHAEAIYSKLTATEQKQAQQIFVQLVQLGEGTADTRRLVTRAEISDDCWQLITRKGGLADCRLVVTGRNDQTNEETVEVVHEALIREWQQLRQWIDTDRKKLLQKNEIEAQAKRWSEKKSKDYLLQGKRLQEAKAFQKEQTSYLSLSPLSREFIQKSLQKRRNNRLRLIGLGLVAPLGLVTFLGFQIQRQMVIREHWETIEKAQGQQDSSARIAALQELVKYGVSLANLSLPATDLSNINLSNAFLPNADLSGASLSNADLTGTTLTSANLRLAWLTSTSLSNAILTGANLSNAILTGANLSKADLSKVNLSKADLVNANLSSANLLSADLSSADLLSADLSNANLLSADLLGTRLSHANLSHANLSGVVLSFADVDAADLSRANLDAADLSGANFKFADLNEANLKLADLSCNSFANLCTDFRGVRNLTPEQVKSAKNWQQAIYNPAFCQQLGLKECKTKQAGEK